MEGRPKFAESLAVQLLGAQVEKRMFRGQFIKRGRLLSVGAFLFENGAIVGHAFRDRFGTFIVPFSSEPDHYSQAVEFARQEGRVVAKRAPEASTIHELFIISEMRKGDPASEAIMWSQWLRFRAEERVPVSLAMQLGTMYQCIGAGFAAEFPDRLESLYLNSYTQTTRESWREAFRAGAVSSPEPPEYVSFQERQSEAVTEFVQFSTQHYPELTLLSGLNEPA